MRITGQTGEYLRPALATFNEIEWLFTVMADWPTGGWTLSRCMDQVSKSAKIRDHAQPFAGLVLVYCLADDTRVGAISCSYHGGPTTGFQVHFAAIHPDYRGVGHFTTMSDLIAYWANQTLQADEAVYQVLPSAPQVTARSHALGGAVGRFEQGRRGEIEEVKMARAAVGDVVRGKRVTVER